MATDGPLQGEYVVTNVCATCKMHTCNEIDLDAVAAEFDPTWAFVVYTPTFAAVQLWVHDDEHDSPIVLLVFRSGVVNLVGAKSEERMWRCLTEFLRRFNDTFMYAYEKTPDIRVTMIAGAATLASPFEARAYMRAFPDDTSYEPAVFPGLKKDMRRHYSGEKIIAHAFNGSRRFVVTGATNAATAKDAAARFAREVALSAAPETHHPRPRAALPTLLRGVFEQNALMARKRRRELGEIRPGKRHPKRRRLVMLI